MDSFRKYWIPIMKPIYRFIRKHSTPMSFDEAERKREILAKVYFASSVTLFTYLIYIAYIRNIEIDKQNDPKLPRHLNIITKYGLKSNENVRYIRFEGFKKTEDFVFNAPEEFKKYKKSELIKEEGEVNSTDHKKDILKEHDEEILVV